ncbi:protein kinase domain-containing protein [Actinomycetospora cinnamomea]|uniref:non-specific serine/threonine protein kinase n=1 Tax=Actinomycetospora cinnamomea TaxID=663609 RepID=A0A2U1FC80_9PSEU|nr:serine/threonine protein kinase [Actinomycetospora cinnamomea]PVZ09580.1 serine/threonine protein kinase [Actinomycetospora cinnamomea]
MDGLDPGAAGPPVPEQARFCASCDGPVGRGRSGRPGPERGTCPWCGAAYDVRPDLAAGTEVAGREGRYRVRAPLVRGARGWSYTATRQGDGALVVLGRLEGPEGPAAGDLAVRETEALLDLDVPGLVRARDVARAAGRNGPVRLLVLDHVTGEPLSARRPCPPAEALDAVLGAVPPLSALHRHGLLHADLNPSNLLVGPGGITVLDLGSVRRVGDRHSDVWATTGFVAPEIHAGGPGPSVASEVFALGRTLAVLLADFDHQRNLALRLPDPAGVPVLRDDPDLVALLRRATDPDPARRHRSVEAFAADARRVRARYPARPGDTAVGGDARPWSDPEDDPTRRGGDRETRRARVARDVRGAPIP